MPRRRRRYSPGDGVLEESVANDRTSADHARVWATIDAIAARHGLTPSALARRAGLDSTTFNKSKRRTSDGRLRWPSTPSILKVLDAIGGSFGFYLGEIRPETARPKMLVPHHDGFAEDGLAGMLPPPAAFLSDTARAPLYAIAVETDALRPFYRQGDTLIVAPQLSPCHGDRVLVLTADGTLAAYAFIRRDAETAEVEPIGEDGPRHTIDMREVIWMARIVWASQ